MKYDDVLFTQILVCAECEEEVRDTDISKLLEMVEENAKEGIDTFGKYRKLANLDLLLTMYISAKRGGEDTEGIKDAVGTLLKGVFQSKKNHKNLLSGVKITSVNRIPMNAATLVKQQEAALEFDRECQLLFDALGEAPVEKYQYPIGMIHQKNMAESREKVKQFAKKYKKN